VKKLLLIFIFVLSLFGADYSAMSTQELLAIMDYTFKKNEQAKILSELKSRLPEMSPKEKKTYEKNLLVLRKRDAKK